MKIKIKFNIGSKVILKKLIAQLLILLISKKSFGLVMGASSISRSGIGHANVNTSDAHFNNPASLAHIDGAWFKVINSNWQNSLSQSEKGWSFNLLENSVETEIPMGISFSKSELTENENKILENTFNLSLGNFIFPQTSLGISYEYKSMKDFLLNSKINSFHKFNIGIIYTTSPNLGISLSAANTIGNENFDYGLGMTYLLEKNLKYNFDFSTNQNYISWRNSSMGVVEQKIFSIGLENMISEWFGWRFGVSRKYMSWNKKSEPYLNPGVVNGMGAGIGFNGPRFQINYGLNQEYGIVNSKSQSVDFLLPF